MKNLTAKKSRYIKWSRKNDEKMVLNRCRIQQKRNFWGGNSRQTGSPQTPVLCLINNVGSAVLTYWLFGLTGVAFATEFSHWLREAWWTNRKLYGWKLPGDGASVWCYASRIELWVWTNVLHKVRDAEWAKPLEWATWNSKLRETATCVF